MKIKIVITSIQITISKFSSKKIFADIFQGNR